MARLEQAMAELAGTPRVGLKRMWEEVCGGPPPLLAPELMRRGLAQRLQEKTHGRLPALVAHELARLAAGSHAPSAPRRPRVAIRPGARLIREWQGRTISVEVVEDGFIWEGTRYASLSGIAKAVTGAHWSGPRFFGVTAHG